VAALASIVMISLALMSCDTSIATSTAAEKVAAAKAPLAIGYAAGDSANSVTANLVLSTSGADAIAISWTSSSPALISATGVVTRPSAGSTDVTVTLIATLTGDSAIDTKVFTLIVKPMPDTSAADVAAAKADLVIGYAIGDTASSVTENLTLSASGTNGVAITWTSSSPAVISASGVVTRPAIGNANVSLTLTATLSRNGATDTKVFTLSVLAMPDTSAADIAAAKAALDIVYATGDSASSVTANLILTTSGANGVAIAWTSSNAGVVSVAGVVTSPAVGSADASVTMTATLSKGGATDTQVFTITVGASPISAPNAPTLQIVSTTNDSISLSWGAIAAVNGYRLYRADSASGTYAQIGADIAVGVSAVDSGLSASTTYWYKVSAFNGSVEGAMSDAVSGTTSGSGSGGISVGLE